VRKPRFALDAAEQVALKPQSEPLRSLVLSEDEHADAAGLPVSRHAERERANAGAAALQRLDHLGQPAARLPAEKGEREVQVVARNDSLALETRLPDGDRVHRVVGKAQAAEEPDLLIALDLSGAGHARS
jgi:hypothetical protein